MCDSQTPSQSNHQRHLAPPSSLRHFLHLVLRTTAFVLRFVPLWPRPFSFLVLTSQRSKILQDSVFFLPLLGPLLRHMGGSQARGLMRAVATSLHQSHSNSGSKLRLYPTPQLMATPDPQPTEQGQGWNLQPQDSQSDSLTTEP